MTTDFNGFCRYLLILCVLGGSWCGVSVCGAQETPAAGGEIDTFKVVAGEKGNSSKVVLKRGREYQLALHVSQALVDGTVTCKNPGPRPDQCLQPTKPLDHEGFEVSGLSWWRRGVLGAAKPFTPLTEANWFELVCRVGQNGRYFPASKYQPASGAPRLVPEEDGRLVCLVNDFPWKYGNNRGELTVTVREPRPVLE